jgi:hypothetical protein
MKTCTRCLEEKPVEEFVVRNASKDGYSHECRECKAARHVIKKAMKNIHARFAGEPKPMTRDDYYPPAVRRLALALIFDAVLSVRKHKKNRCECGREGHECSRIFLDRSPELRRWLSMAQVDPESAMVSRMIKKELA